MRVYFDRYLHFKTFIGTLSASPPGHLCRGSMGDGLNLCNSGSGAHGHFILPGEALDYLSQMSPWRFVAAELLELIRFTSTGHRD